MESSLKHEFIEGFEGFPKELLKIINKGPKSKEVEEYLNRSPRKRCQCFIAVNKYNHAMFLVRVLENDQETIDISDDTDYNIRVFGIDEKFHVFHLAYADSHHTRYRVFHKEKGINELHYRDFYEIGDFDNVPFNLFYYLAFQEIPKEYVILDKDCLYYVIAIATTFVENLAANTDNDQDAEIFKEALQEIKKITITQYSMEDFTRKNKMAKVSGHLSLYASNESTNFSTPAICVLVFCSALIGPAIVIGVWEFMRRKL